MKKLIRERVVPTISASVSWLIFGITDSGWSWFSKVCQQDQHARQPLLAGVEQLVDEVLFDLDVARQQIRDEELGELLLSMERADHVALVHPQDAGRLDRGRGGHPEGLGRQAALAKEAAWLHEADDGFLSSRRDDREPDLAALYVEHGIGRVALGIDDLLAPILPRRLSFLDPREEGLGIEGERRLGRRGALVRGALARGTLVRMASSFRAAAFRGALAAPEESPK